MNNFFNGNTVISKTTGREYGVYRSDELYTEVSYWDDKKNEQIEDTVRTTDLMLVTE